MTDLTGSLVAIGLGPLLGFLSELRLSGRLAITDGALTGALYLEAGRVVGAQFGSETGAAAFESIVLLLAAGQFELASDADRQLNFMATPDDIERRLEALSAERARLARLVPSIDAVPQPVLTQAEDGAEVVTVDLGTLRLWLQFDGQRSVLNIGNSRGLLRTVRAVARLVELGLISLDQADQAPDVTTATPPRAEARPWSALDHRRTASDRSR